MARLFLYITLLFLCCFFRHPVQAQQEGRAVVRMQLLDSLTGKPVAYATISIYPAGEKDPIRFGVSDDEGYAEIVKIEKGKFLISIEHLSYNTVLKYISTEKERVTDFGKIRMTERSIGLDEAVVTGEAAIIQKGDTTEYNAKFFNPAPTEYLGDLLKKMPGLEIVGKDIYFKGVKVESLTVEGRPFFMSDNAIALENLPAYTVKKVSVFKRNRSMLTGIENIANAPLQLNVTLKDGMKTGIIGNLTPGYGTESRYLVKGMLGHFGRQATTAYIISANNISKDAGNSSTYQFGPGGIITPQLTNNISGYEGDIKTILSGIDYARSKSSSPDLTYLNATYRNGDKFLATLTKRETSLTDGILTHISAGTSTGQSNEGGITFRLNKVINRAEKGKRNIFSFYWANLNYQKEKFEHQTLFSSARQGNTASNNNGETLNAGDRQNIGFNTNFYLNLARSKAKFHFSGMGLGLSYHNSDNDYRNYSKTIFDHQIPQLINQKKEDKNEQLQTNSYITFGMPGDLTFTYSIRYQNANSNAKAWDYDSQTGQYQDISHKSTGKLKNATLEQGLEVKKIFSIPDGPNMNYWTLSASLIPLRKETSNKDFSTSYRKWNFIPLISYRSKRFNFKYTGHIQHPTLDQLQPIENNNNPLYIFIGNADLRPSYTHMLDVSKTVGIFNFEAEGSLTRNKIIQKQNIDAEGITRSLPVNANGDYQAKLGIRIQTSLGRRIRFGSYLSGRYVRGIGYLDAEKYTSDNYTAIGTLGLTYSRTFFEISVDGHASYSDSRFSTQALEGEATWINGVSASLNWGLPFGFTLLTQYNYTYYIGFESDNTPSSVWNAELCKTAFKKRVVFSLKGYDLLNQTKNLKTTYADNYIEEYSVNMIRRYVMLSASFKFGKF